MTSNKQRVITVAFDKKATLHRIAIDALDLFPKNPTSAYSYVIKKLKAEGIEFLDHDLNIKELPDYMAHWHFPSSDADEGAL